MNPQQPQPSSKQSTRVDDPMAEYRYQALYSLMIVPQLPGYANLGEISLLDDQREEEQ